MGSKDLIQLNKQTYNTIAKFFDKTRKYLWDDLKPLKKYTKAGDRVLDIGCGTGRLYQLFEEIQDTSYFGIDQSEGQIELAKENYTEGSFQVMEMTELDFADNEFDLIFCIATFNHLPDEETRLKSLSEMKRVLKPNGKVIMTNWNLFSKSVGKVVQKGKFKKEGQEFIVPWMNSQGEVLGERYYHGFTLGELEDLFNKVGFNIEQNYYSKKAKHVSSAEGHNIVTIVSVQ